MSIPPESIEVGKYYLSEEGRVRRVVKFLPDGRVRYAYRTFPGTEGETWRTGRLEVKRFAVTTLREVPFAQTPEKDGASPCRSLPRASKSASAT